MNTLDRFQKELKLAQEEMEREIARIIREHGLEGVDVEIETVGFINRPKRHKVKLSLTIME